MENAFLKRKTGNGSAYNYELSPLIENFTFYDFIDEAKKEPPKDHGAFLVITNKQYIIGYNAGFGNGTHMSAFARTFKDINGGGIIGIEHDAILLSIKCQKNYLTAKICYESCRNNLYRNPNYKGTITFELSSIDYKITKEQFDVFEIFYNDYNEDIKYITKKNDIYVRFSYLDEKGNLIKSKTTDLDELYNYLLNNIDYNKQIEEETVILGKAKKIQTLS